MAMHDAGWIIPVGIVAIIAARQTLTTWIRARHGYPLLSSRAERRRGRGNDDSELTDQRKIGLLTDENQRLTNQVSRLEERLAVLERIATDANSVSAKQTRALSDEIESLRDR